MFLEEISHGRIYSKKNGKQVDGRTERRAGEKADGQTDKQDRRTNSRTYRHTNIGTDRHIQKDRRTD